MIMKLKLMIYGGAITALSINDLFVLKGIIVGLIILSLLPEQKPIVPPDKKEKKGKPDIKTEKKDEAL